MLPWHLICICMDVRMNVCVRARACVCVCDLHVYTSKFVKGRDSSFIIFVFLAQRIVAISKTKMIVSYLRLGGNNNGDFVEDYFFFVLLLKQLRNNAKVINQTSDTWHHTQHITFTISSLLVFVAHRDMVKFWWYWQATQSETSAMSEKLRTVNLISFISTAVSAARNIFFHWIKK